MFNISKFLERFSKNIKNSEIYNKQILEIIKKQTGIEILPELMETKEYVLYIKSSPAVKNKLFIFKESLLKEISTSIPITIIDIR